MAEDSFPLRVSLFIFMYDELQAQDHLRWEGERWKEKTKAAERERSTGLTRCCSLSLALCFLEVFFMEAERSAIREREKESILA